MKVNINYICYLIIFVAFGFIYRRYMDKYDMLNSEKEEILIQKYLLTDNKFKNNKPFLWIHVPYEINSRSWESFKSRQNTNLNLPYMYLTIKSIIKHCGDSFNICLIDDKSFSLLIPDWKHDVVNMANPTKEKIRYLGLINLIYIYGGFLVPASFICKKNLIDIYDENDDKLFIFESRDKVYDLKLTPDPYFLASFKNNEIVYNYKDYIEKNIMNDLTARSIFCNNNQRWCFNEYLNNNIKIVDSRIIGIKNNNNKIIDIPELLGEQDINFDNKFFGILIPYEKILNMSHYNWFCYNENDLLNSNLTISKYIKRFLI